MYKCLSFIHYKQQIEYNVALHSPCYSPKKVMYRDPWTRTLDHRHLRGETNNLHLHFTYRQTLFYSM